jgi:hypothetical protein
MDDYKYLMYFTSHVLTYNSAILWGTTRYILSKKTINYSYIYFAVYNWTFLLQINHVFLNKAFFRLRHFPLQILSSTLCDQHDDYAFVSDR